MAALWESAVSSDRLFVAGFCRTALVSHCVDLSADTWQGWLYLAVVMDRFSRMIIGWVCWSESTPRARVECRADRRSTSAASRDHSDQGCRYGSDDWRRFCRTNHLEPSMSRRGNCWDNAVAESFFARSEEGADQETHLQEPRAGPGGRVRLHPLVLQSHKAPFSPRRRQPVRPSRPMQSARSNVSTESWVLQTSAWRSSAQDSGTVCARF